VGAGPTQGDLEAHGALAAGLDGAAGGLAEDGGVAGQQVGPLGEERAQPVVDGRHLLAGVEDVRDVDRGVDA
jgi:hypothetical protein